MLLAVHVFDRAPVRITRDGGIADSAGSAGAKPNQTRVPTALARGIDAFTQVVAESAASRSGYRLVQRFPEPASCD